MKEYYRLEYIHYSRYDTVESWRISGQLIENIFLNTFSTRPRYYKEVPFIIVKDGERYFEFFTQTEFYPVQKIEEPRYYTKEPFQYICLVENNTGLSFKIITSEYRKFLEDNNVDEWWAVKHLIDIEPESVMKAVEYWLDKPKYTKEATERMQKYFEAYRQRKLELEAEKAKQQAEEIAAERRRAQEHENAVSRLESFFSRRK